MKKNMLSSIYEREYKKCFFNAENFGRKTIDRPLEKIPGFTHLTQLCELKCIAAEEWKRFGETESEFDTLPNSEDKFTVYVKEDADENTMVTNLMKEAVAYYFSEGSLYLNPEKVADKYATTAVDIHWEKLLRFRRRRRRHYDATGFMDLLKEIRPQSPPGSPRGITLLGY